MWWPHIATLDQVVENLRKNFSEGTEYFQLLVEVFSSRFSSSKVDRKRKGSSFFSLKPWLPDGYSQIFRSYVFVPLGFWTMAPIR